MAVRIVSLALGVWLFVSAFLWPHPAHVALTTWIPGALIAIVAAVAIAVPPARFLNALLGAWVLAAALAGGDDVLVWNNGVVGLAVVIAALVPTLPAAWPARERAVAARRA